MANRCMLFAARGVPMGAPQPVTTLALGEFCWGIPTLYKFLVSVNPQMCRSAVFGHTGPLAIVGDREGGLARLKALRAGLSKNARATASLDAAITYLSRTHIDQPYFLLEPGEILDLDTGSLDAKLHALHQEIGSMRVDTMMALAETSAEAGDWATDSWSSILYYDPPGAERPPLDPGETFLSTSVTHLLTQYAALSQCHALKRVYMTLDGDKDILTAALMALGDIPGPFELTLNGALTQLPDSVAALSNVTSLGLGSLGLRSLPVSLAALPRLESLYLQSNCLDVVPACLRNMPNLKQLSLRQNQLRDLPAWIGELRGLETLWIDSCDLASVPKELWTLSNLKVLNLMANPELRRLPPGIEGLISLVDLNLVDCGLDACPDSVCKLPRLKLLYLGMNKLVSLPDCLYEMPLDTLSLAGNPMRKPSWFSLRPQRRFRAAKVHWG